ncbi:hypothetical protein OOJ91_07610 [Micromonospora lupini]|uniref:allene oxide cyclase barrel-like domain-containing protein n=1 Tax=Micromonospora lupini TaxID=285679 RepID=UPI00225A9DD8|nr:hypothetical protein [Micromonospora lupini]MCX5065746.1 hypothetical protein [Micromonospora lupini]
MLELRMIEKTTKIHVNMEVDPRHVPVGWVALYFDDLYDESGTELIGKAYGVNHAIGERKSDGHMIQYVTEQFHLEDGSLCAEGPMDREAVIAQEWVQIPVKGTAGIYLGMSGLWSWRLIDLTDPLIPLVSNIKLGP